MFGETGVHEENPHIYWKSVNSHFYYETMFQL